MDVMLFPLRETDFKFIMPFPLLSTNSLFLKTLILLKSRLRDVIWLGSANEGTKVKSLCEQSIFNSFEFETTWWRQFWAIVPREETKVCTNTCRMNTADAFMVCEALSKSLSSTGINRSDPLSAKQTSLGAILLVLEKLHQLTTISLSSAPILKNQLCGRSSVRTLKSQPENMQVGQFPVFSCAPRAKVRFRFIRCHLRQCGRPYQLFWVSCHSSFSVFVCTLSLWWCLEKDPEMFVRSLLTVDWIWGRTELVSCFICFSQKHKVISASKKQVNAHINTDKWGFMSTFCPLFPFLDSSKQEQKQIDQACWHLFFSWSRKRVKQHSQRTFGAT